MMHFDEDDMSTRYDAVVALVGITVSAIIMFGVLAMCAYTIGRFAGLL